MKNDKQIAFTDLSFQTISEKICNNGLECKTNFVECLNLHFVFVGYFTYDLICNPNRDYDLKYWKVYSFFQIKPNNYAYVTITSQQRCDVIVTGW